MTGPDQPPFLTAPLKAFADARRRSLPLDAQVKHAKAISAALETLDGQALDAALARLATQPGWMEQLAAAQAALRAANAPLLLSDHPDRAQAHTRCLAAVALARAKAAGGRVFGLHRWHPETAAHTIEVRLIFAGREQLGSFCWEIVDLQGIRPLVAHLELATMLDQVEYRLEARPPLDTPGPLDRYHPERFRGIHRYVDQMGPSVAHLYRPTSQDEYTHAHERLAALTIEAFNRRLRLLPQAVFDHEPPRGSVPITQAMSLASHGAIFRTFGRQIFDLPPALVERFRETDVDDVPLSMLQLPYEGFYLYWGTQADLELEPGWKVEGAYISGQLPQLLQVLVTCSPDDPGRNSWWPIYPEPYYYQAFEAEHLAKDVGTAVDEVLAADSQLLREKVKNGLGPGLAEAVADHDAADLPDIVDISPITSAAALAALERRHATYVQALRLVVNALCYLTAYPGDLEAAYSDEAPRDLVRATLSPDVRIAKRARDRLAQLGYVPIHLCGKELANLPDSVAVGIGQTRRAHWRRGHWRRQPYGEGRLLRKLIWVMPMVVAPNNRPDGDEPPGHLYLVS